MDTAASIASPASGPAALQRRSPWLRSEVAVPAIGILLVLALQAHLALIKSINWDEFYHFSLIHASLRGEQVEILQTPFVWLFGWVPALPGDTIDHIRVIRLLMLPFELIVLVGIVASARRFTDDGAAFLCGLAYLTAGFVFTQGLALRADTIAAALMIMLVAVGLSRPLNAATGTVSAVLGLLAFLATIKSLLYLPVVIAVVTSWWKGGAKPSLRIVIFGVIVAGAATGLAAHLDLLAYVFGKLQSSAERMFGDGILPQGRYVARQIVGAVPFSLLLIMSVVWLWRSRLDTEHKPALALLMLPVLWPLVYFNAYPYFYAFILAPVAVALAPAIGLARTRYGMVPLVSLLVLNGALLWAIEPRGHLAVQQNFQAEVRAIFPQPVEYIDESGMIGDYPRAIGHFASGWALSNYRQKGEATYLSSVVNGQVVMLITNSHALHNIFHPQARGDRLLPADDAFLRDNFIPHSGMIHVAGKQLGPFENRPSELVATAGRYIVEGGPMRIDGKVYRSGSLVSLSRKKYDLENPARSATAIRWAAAGPRRHSQITLQDLFTDY